MTTDWIIFYGLGFAAIAAALGMLFSRNAVYSALFLIFNFSIGAVFYLILGAPFIALVQVTVYAGAIMVLFLFVIMLLGAEQVGRKQTSWWSQPLALSLGVILLVEAIYIVFTYRADFPQALDVAANFGNPAEVGKLLFSDFLIPFEATSILLLAAMIGAIVLTKRKV